jgi:APA family basic amino acid/polyamine antiporter
VVGGIACLVLVVTLPLGSVVAGVVLLAVGVVGRLILTR